MVGLGHGGWGHDRKFGPQVSTSILGHDVGHGLLEAARSRPRFQVETGWTACRFSSGSRLGLYVSIEEGLSGVAT